MVGSGENPFSPRKLFYFFYLFFYFFIFFIIFFIFSDHQNLKIGYLVNERSSRERERSGLGAEP